MHRAWLIVIALGAGTAAADPDRSQPSPSAAKPAPGTPERATSPGKTPSDTPPAKAPPAKTSIAPPSSSPPGAPPATARPSRAPPSGARSAATPAERADDLIDIAAVIPDAVIDIRYATADNFTGKVLYPVARCKLRRAVAARLAKAATALRAQDRRLVLWDCYRPRSIQQELWRRVPDPRYVADPRVGSKHGRGAAVDVALVDQAGKAVVLPTKFDDFSPAAHRDQALAGEPGAEARRLEAAMAAAGFQPLATEWWHFDAPDSANYALSDEAL
ncbi:MAG: M15 family metallopeptidase [Kofleriaceae bacterium]